MRYQSVLILISIVSMLVGSTVIIVAGLSLTHKVAAQTTPSIIFRLDDVQDNFANNGTKAVLDLFMQKKVPLTTGIIASAIGKDQIITSATAQGIKSGLFEPALHGNKHVDYTTLNANNQSVSMTQGNTELKKLFGVHPFVFIPPFNAFNNGTLSAMRAHDMNIISSTLGSESLENSTSSIYNASAMKSCGSTEAGVTCHYANPAHVSAGNDFRVITDANITQRTNTQLLKEIQDNVKNYGYSILVLHPQDFVFTDVKTGKVLQNQVNTKQIAQLSTLIDQIKKQYIPTSMTDLVNSNAKASKTFGVTATEPRKIVVLTLDDDWVGQYKYGIPILQRYHYNATFFVTCEGPTQQAPSFVRGTSPDITTWQQVIQEKELGFDIENHGMTHHSLVNQPASVLQREIIDSKACLESHLRHSWKGWTAKVFAPAYAAPENNATVNNYISKAGYEFARNGYGTGDFDSHQFDLPTNSMNSLDKQYAHNTQAIMNAFPDELKKGNLPVLVYHNINTLANTDPEWHNSTTTPETFDAEMKWLKDNGYEVHSIGDLKWDSQNGRFTL